MAAQEQATLEKMERTKERWLQVMKRKEELQQAHTITIRKQLGKSFNREKETVKRVKTEGEYEKI